ncbi:MAG TPA: gliding motility-associated C-terminal domain-containing protein, partial [Flavobacteriales bacterium]|nr:gliding motility-associated C-terminal domain-containing protein [Flavobacteriales bacterium]
IYVVTVTDLNGCTDEATATISALACLCVADFINEGKCMQEPVQFTLLADSMVVSVHWDFEDVATASSDFDPVVRFNADKEVLVTLEATLTCGAVTVQHKVRVPDCTDSCSVWVPSAFTPDGDTKNEAWTWSGECMPEDFSIAVFNRWGEVVFSSTDPKRSWDGTYGGALSPPGIYAYRVGYRLPYQKHKEVRGSLTLLR